MTTDERSARYARLAVEVGLNLTNGQDLLIDADVVHVPLVRQLASAAYACGARHVDVVLTDSQTTRAQIVHARADSLGFTPEWVAGRLDGAVRSAWWQERLGRDHQGERLPHLGHRRGSSGAQVGHCWPLPYLSHLSAAP